MLQCTFGVSDMFFAQLCGHRSCTGHCFVQISELSFIFILVPNSRMGGNKFIHSMIFETFKLKFEARTQGQDTKLPHMPMRSQTPIFSRSLSQNETPLTYVPVTPSRLLYCIWTRPNIGSESNRIAKSPTLLQVIAPSTVVSKASVPLISSHSSINSSIIYPPLHPTNCSNIHVYKQFSIYVPLMREIQ